MSLISKLKSAGLKRIVKRISKIPVLGWPIHALIKLNQNPAFSLQHLVPEHRTHNRRQTAILTAFEQQTRGLK